MIALTLGFTSASRRADPHVLYCGSDANAAEALMLTPPPGIVRVELLKNPPITRRRSYPENVLPVEPSPEQEKPVRAKVKL